jgi:hypothetical protein
MASGEFYAFPHTNGGWVSDSEIEKSGGRPTLQTQGKPGIFVVNR